MTTKLDSSAAGRRSLSEIGRLLWSRATVVVENVAIYGVSSALAVTILYPILWMVSTSLKSKMTIYKTITQLIPYEMYFGNYRSVFEQTDFSRYYFNSLLVTVCSVVGLLLITSMAAYSFARIEWRRKNWVFGLIVMGQMVAPVSLIIPAFIVLNALHLTSTYQGVIFWYLSRVPFGTFVLRPFFESMPREIEDAARIDGCSTYAIYRRIALPLALPSIASVGIFYFFFVWNDFLYPFIALQKAKLTTIPVAIYNLKGRYAIAWGTQTAALVMAIVPSILVSIFFQRQIVSGLTTGAVKG